TVSNAQSLKALNSPEPEINLENGYNNNTSTSGFYPSRAIEEEPYEDFNNGSMPSSSGQLKPIIIDDKTKEHYSSMEVVEENLSLEENEKELIRKALKKHNGRRKEAAQDLGISERTLYRKIKQYEL
ncbi:MAG: helix-turn-helix domain-containing protein, partial [Bacteroidota bacterium]